MSKKSKKKARSKREAEMRKRFGKDRKKGKGKLGKNLGGKSVKATLNEKQYKKLDQKIEALSDIPELREPRKVCNHQGKKDIALVSLKNYEGETFVVKNLESMINVFGEENVGVCKKCRVAVPELSCIGVDDLERAHMVIASAVEHIVTRTDDRKEVELLHKALKNFEEDFRIINKKFRKTLDKSLPMGKLDRDDFKRPVTREVTSVRQRETRVTTETSSGFDADENVVFTR